MLTRGDDRPSSAKRGYGRAWRRRREQYLAHHPLCENCLEQGKTVASTDVDHRTSRAKGGDDSDENLRALCHPCHSAKTVREDGGLGRRPAVESATDRRGESATTR